MGCGAISRSPGAWTAGDRPRAELRVPKQVLAVLLRALLLCVRALACAIGKIMLIAWFLSSQLLTHMLPDTHFFAHLRVMRPCCMPSPIKSYLVA